jgi:hypothetical protein
MGSTRRRTAGSSKTDAKGRRERGGESFPIDSQKICSRIA